MLVLGPAFFYARSWQWWRESTVVSFAVGPGLLLLAMHVVLHGCYCAAFAGRMRPRTVEITELRVRSGSVVRFERGVLPASSPAAAAPAASTSSSFGGPGAFYVVDAPALLAVVCAWLGVFFCGGCDRGGAGGCSSPNAIFFCPSIFLHFVEELWH